MIKLSFKPFTEFSSKAIPHTATVFVSQLQIKQE